MEWFSDNETLIQAALAGAVLAYSFQIAMRAGVFTLAGVGFWAVGGYTTAYLVTEREWATVPAVLAGIVISAIVGLLLALVLGRLRSLYLAMATVAFVLLVQIVAINWEDFTGGAGGMFGIPVTVTTTQLFLIVAVVSVALFLFERGARGRTIEAMRLDEHVAQSVGINVVRERNMIFVLSAMLAALSGGISAMMFNTLAPEQAGFNLIADTLMMVVIGGAAAWWGALVGAFIVTWLPELLRFTGDYRGIVEGLIVVLVVVYAPEGFVGLVRRIRGLISGRRLPVTTPLADDTATAMPDAEHAQPEAALPKGRER
jgi:branched-chain amino acid transport system permease protein